jgi:hypothetical protein
MISQQNNFPQSAASAISFIDRADEQQLDQMIKARNPYSSIALSRLQSLRDAKMRDQSQEKTFPPLSQTIPEQLQNLSKPVGIQQLPQGMPQGMPEGASQGLASIGGAPTGAGGGMVAFNHGGGIRKFSEPDNSGGVRHFYSGNKVDDYGSPVGTSPALESSKTTKSSYTEPSIMQRFINNILSSKKVDQFGSPVGESPLPEDFYRDKAEISYTEPSGAQRVVNSMFSGPKSTAPVPLTPEQTNFVETQKSQQFQAQNAGASGSRVPAVPVGDQSGSNSGLGRLSKGALDLLNQSKNSLGPGFLAQQAATENTANVMRQEQAKLDAAYDPAKFTAAQGTQEERDKLQADRLAKLEQSMPDPYKKTAEKLSSLGEELGKDKANAPYQAMLSTAFKLMSNKTPYFMTALGDAGAAGLTEYNQIRDANKKQEMSLMSAETSLSAAQDARKRGMNNDANAYMKEFYDRKKDAFNFGLESAKAKSLAAIQLAGQGEKLPQQQIDQAKTLVTLHEAFFKHNEEIQKLRQEGERTSAAMIPEAGKLALYLSKHPGLAPYIERSEDVALTAKLLLAEEKNPENIGKSEEALVERVGKMVAAARRANPMPMTYGK